MEIVSVTAAEWIDTECGVRFLCDPLDAATYMDVMALAEGGEPGQAGITAIMKSARNWEGPTKAGVPVKFTRSALLQFFSSASQVGTLGELGRKIIERSRLTEIERKN